MKKKNTSQGTFIPRFLSCLSKLKDNSTIQTAHQQLRQLFQQFDLQEISNLFQHLDMNDNLSDRTKKQYVRVYATLCEVYGYAIFDVYDRFLNSLFKKIQFGSEVSQSLSNVVQLFKDFDYDQQIRYSQSILKHITSTNNYVSMGLTIRAFIRALNKSMVGYFQDFLVDLILEKVSLAKQKQQLLQALLSLMLGLEQQFAATDKIMSVLPGLMKDEDWNVRRVAIDIYYTLIVLKGFNGQKNLLRLVEEAKYDKIKNVRDAAANCYNVIKEFGGVPESPKFNIERVKSPGFKSKNSKLSKTAETKTMDHVREEPVVPKSPTAAERSKNKSAINRSAVFKNQSFFKNAQQNDVILTMKQPTKQEQEEVQTVVPLANKDPNISLTKKFTFQEPSVKSQNEDYDQMYELKKNQNDSLEQLANMIPINIESKPFLDVSSPLSKDSSHFSIQSKEHSKWKAKPTKKLQQIVEMPSSSELRTGEQSDELSIGWLATQIKKVLERVCESQDTIMNRLVTFENRLSNVETRMTIIEQRQLRQSRNKQRNVSHSQYDRSRIQLYLTEHNEQTAAIESNVEDKVKRSLEDGNYAEAYGLALANNKEDTILRLIEKTGMIADRLDVVHVEVLLLKLKDFIFKRQKTKMCLEWIREFVRSGINQTKTAKNAIHAVIQQYKPYHSDEVVLLNDIRDNSVGF